MTDIIVHGILAKEFRANFKFKINSPKEIFDAISCIYPKFRNRLAELTNQGIHYSILINGNKIRSEVDLMSFKECQTIDLIPTICGAGSSGGIIATLALGLATGGLGLAAGGFFGTFASLSSLAAYSTTLTSIGVGLIGMSVQAMLAPKPDMQRPSADVGAAKQSFNFSSKANTTEQGIPVPVGYGRLRVGSSVIQSSIKSYPQAFNKEDSIDSEGSISLTNAL
jgi:predicted phage tail protein